MEHLTKSQLVLLAVFVSFVTSISASIVTTAQLSRNAPTSSPIIQTVNRVIEKVIPVPTPVVTEASPPSDEPKAPNSEDLIIHAIERNAGSFTEMVLQGAESSSIVRGVAVSGDTLLVPAGAATVPDRYVRGGEGAYAVTLATTTMNGFSVATVGERIKLRSDTSTTTPDKKPLHLSPVTFSTGSLPKVGQAVILVSGEDGGSADYGIVSSLIERTEEEVSVRRIKTSIPLGSGDLGKVLVHPATGEVIGIVAQEGGNIWVVPAGDLRTMLAPPSGSGAAGVPEASGTEIS
ncbi:MAG: hypothetical protein A2408_01130 [Candidatus Yonathbacteria bacterium RIFOXYC1_FULL_52_10]|uniref:Uncharacterized protein n=1 Tax=Candidatus Yonathbacteria bacterium RIFOXYD1_FULL_52_36 TaxID=1802730 RepID=A0A1G2SLB8_9BACT|nr:MAG: hypothetical protein A2408_01130 [Candidatus Yonathbacteria bacterium RIFOXYC1_FULL_52_10]OHA85572.1 MAG: hypothetical protein A2591_00185 [Candidatus Yonathbacteria bacterium RIFOXYD1_FULL_52_36]